MKTKKVRSMLRKAHIDYMKAKDLQQKKEAQSEIRYWTMRDTQAIKRFVEATQ